jgi:Flp pilus assembly protein TadB
MIGAALGLVVIGLVLVFFLPWVGIPVGAVGLLLLLLYLVGFGRRAAQGREGP